MNKMTISQAIVVEGRYDKNALSQVVEALILVTNGFGIFRDKDQMILLRKVAEERGILLLTDSDGAGFVIRQRISSILPKHQVKHGYIPDIYGKEKRKVQASKEGKLGVEGMPVEVLREVLERAGASFDHYSREEFSNTDFYNWGLTGEGSREKRGKLLEKMGLPQHMTKKGLLDLFSACYEREEILRQIQEIEQEER